MQFRLNFFDPDSIPPRLGYWGCFSGSRGWRLNKSDALLDQFLMAVMISGPIKAHTEATAYLEWGRASSKCICNLLAILE